ncbi:hypothetical protein BKA81DRAFT_358081 [Phyllosticta paracitricarpa]
MPSSSDDARKETEFRLNLAKQPVSVVERAGNISKENRNISTDVDQIYIPNDREETIMARAAKHSKETRDKKKSQGNDKGNDQGKKES